MRVRVFEEHDPVRMDGHKPVEILLAREPGLVAPYDLSNLAIVRCVRLEACARLDYCHYSWQSGDGRLADDFQVRARQAAAPTRPPGRGALLLKLYLRAATANHN